MANSKNMQNYCGDIKHDTLLDIGLSVIQDYEKNFLSETFAYNPHELTRLLEVFNILTISQIILHACKARNKNSKSLCFTKAGSLEERPSEAHLIVLKNKREKVKVRRLPIDFYGDFKENYEKYNGDYIKEKSHA
jgi:hypothetical protein